jgi:gamma-polyglutamate biosynthesis protein CapC
VITMVVGFAVGMAIRGLVAGYTQLTADPLAAASADPAVAMAAVVGFIIPGLIALWMDRTGPVLTLSPLIVASVVVRLVLIAFGLEAWGA